MVDNTRTFDVEQILFKKSYFTFIWNWVLHILKALNIANSRFFFLLLVTYTTKNYLYICGYYLRNYDEDVSFQTQHVTFQKQDTTSRYTYLS